MLIYFVDYVYYNEWLKVKMCNFSECICLVSNTQSLAPQIAAGRNEALYCNYKLANKSWMFAARSCCKCKYKNTQTQQKIPKAITLTRSYSTGAYRQEMYCGWQTELVQQYWKI